MHWSKARKRKPFAVHPQQMRGVDNYHCARALVTIVQHWQTHGADERFHRYMVRAAEVVRLPAKPMGNPPARKAVQLDLIPVTRVPAGAADAGITMMPSPSLRTLPPGDETRPPWE